MLTTRLLSKSINNACIRMKLLAGSAKLCRLQPCAYAYNIQKKFSNTSINLDKHLIVEPSSCLQDEPVHIKVNGLEPGTEVTLTSALQDIRQQTFFTFTHYRADSSGIIDLSKHGSIGGTYEGLFPMGPLAALKPGPEDHKYLRYVKRDVHKPNLINLNLLKGHLKIDEAYKVNPQLILDSAVNERVYMAPGTKRIPVRDGRLRGTLFLPAGDGPFPGVIDIFGTAGGLVEYRSAQFASRGIASLALAYFDFEDLPKGLDEIHLSYFEEAVKFLLSHEQVKQGAVGALGVSKGGDLVCSMGTFIPEVKAVVCINGIPVNTWCPLILKDRSIPGLFFDISRPKIMNPELISSYDMLSDSEIYPETHLPLHEADAEFLFMVALDDQNWNSNLETSRAVERLKAKKKNNWKFLRYEGAGHLIEPPYSPFCEASYHKLAGVGLFWGGSTIEHSAAQEDSWKVILEFFKNKLE